jgi:hypothetical protein
MFRPETLTVYKGAPGLDFMTTAQDGGKVVSFTYRLTLPLGSAPGTRLC